MKYQSKKQQLIHSKFNGYKARAEKKGKRFNLTFEEFEKLCLDKCFYCGWEGLDRKNGNGVDRIDSDKGYSQDNVVTACSYCNHMKSDGSPASFVGHCLKVIFHTIPYYKILQKVVENMDDLFLSSKIKRMNKILSYQPKNTQNGSA